MKKISKHASVCYDYLSNDEEFQLRHTMTFLTSDEKLCMQVTEMKRTSHSFTILDLVTKRKM
jgi:hypothetical protein